MVQYKNSGARLQFSTPYLAHPIPKTGGTPSRVLPVRHHEMRALLFAHGQRCFHDSRQLPRICLKPCLPQWITTPKLCAASRPLSSSSWMYWASTTGTGNQFAIFITDFCTIVPRVIMSLKTTAPRAVPIFFDHWITLYEIPAFLVMDNVLQFVTKFFGTWCIFLRKGTLWPSLPSPNELASGMLQ